MGKITASATQLKPDGRYKSILASMFNSFVANYLVRLHGGTHVTASIASSLPMPRPPRDSMTFGRVAALARELAGSSASKDAYVELQALAALLYGCRAADFSHVLDTFPLVDSGIRHACDEAFTKLEPC